jgi:hypothetical protein
VEQKEWLVSIDVKDWIAGDRNITYEEVLAIDEYYARHTAARQFETRIRYCPIIRRKMEKRGLNDGDWCASAAVEID